MRAPLPLEIVHAIRLPTWRALFDAIGPPLPARAGAPAPAVDTHEAVAAALRACDLPLPLARAVHTILTFSDEPARTDVYAAARALGLRHRWPEASSPADLVASLLAAAPRDPAIADLLEAAQILRDRVFRPRATAFYVGVPSRDPQIGVPGQYVDPWRAALEAWAEDGDFGAVASADASFADGIARFDLAHEDRRATQLLLETAVVARAVRSHEVRYEPATRRLWITTALPEIVTPLAQMAGRVLFGDERHFFDERAFDLGKLQELGEDALALPALAPKLTAKATSGAWSSGKGHAIRPRGPDLFQALRRYKIRIEGGSLDDVTLRAKVHARTDGPPSADVVLRPPHALTFSEAEHSALLRELLDEAKITNPEPRVRDFFSFQPWTPPAAEWVAWTGPEAFARLVEMGVLVADRSNRAVAPPGDPHAGRVATAYPLRDGRFLAWSPDPTLAPFVVSEEDLVVYALHFGKLASMIAGALGLEGPASSLDDDGVLFCGRRALGPTHVLVFLLTRPIRPATGERLRELAEHGHAIVIAPEGRPRAHGLRQIAMPALAGPWRPLLGAVVRALHVESHVDTTIYAPTDARVVLHRATMRVWIDGVLCAALTEIHFRLLDLLVERTGQLVYTKDIADRVSQGRAHDDTTRKAIDSFVPAVKRSFKASGVRAPKDLPSLIAQPRRGYYALSAKAFAE